MPWVRDILEVVRVVSRAVPFVETTHAVGTSGREKQQAVWTLAIYEMGLVAGLRITPAVQVALLEKIHADVRLLNALRDAHQPPGPAAITPTGSSTPAVGGSPATTTTDPPSREDYALTRPAVPPRARSRS